MATLLLQFFIYFTYFEVALACFGGTLIRGGGLSCYEKDEIIRLHNELRSRVAVGNEGTQPPAQNMMEMCWDDQLAQEAQRWAYKCLFEHDKNRHLSRFNVGQNIYKSMTTPFLDEFGTSPDFNRAIYGWFDEVEKFGFPESFRKTGHYSQLVWADTYLVGCGYTAYRNGTGFIKLYVCNYGPSGNILGKPPYNTGYPACFYYRKGSSKNYDGLCVSRECYSKPCYYYPSPSIFNN